MGEPSFSQVWAFHVCGVAISRGRAAGAPLDLTTMLLGLAVLLPGIAVSGGDATRAATRLLRDTHDYSCIAEGRVFVAPSWLPDNILQALRHDVRSLLDAGALEDHDELLGRRLKLELMPHDWSALDEAAPSEARAQARGLFDELRGDLEKVLGRSLSMEDYGAQAKYTLGKVGEPVHRHTDQRHEALGGQIMMQDERTRRSIAWLLYLSDDDWDEPGGSGSGGKLRAYPRRDSVGVVGAHGGCQQVGWLERGRGAEPVFLDSWVVPSWMAGRSLSDLRAEWSDELPDESDLWSALYKVQPSYVLFVVNAQGEREELSEPHDAPQRDEVGELLDGEPPSLREMLPEALRAGFSSTVCEHPMQSPPVEVSPKGGTLVVFDTLAVPHEVDEVLSGERLLLFGFFAEERPIPPAWQDHAHSVCGDWFPDGWAHTDDMD